MKRNCRTPHVERLEQRQVMCSSLPVVVDGTAGNDIIEVSASPNSYDQIMVKLNGLETGPYCPEGAIRIRGLAGADIISIDSGVYLPSEIDGGTGMDTLDGGSGNDVFLTRDDEMDVIRGGLGMDQAATDSHDEPAGIETINPASPGAAIEPLRIKILVVNYDPIVPQEGNRRLYEIFGWSNPRTLAEGYKADLERASGGAIQFEVVEWRDVNEIPVFDNGFQYNPNAYVQTRRANSGFNQGKADFPRMVQDQGIVPLIDSGAIDEVWFFGDHFFHLPGESWMAGPGAFFINGPVYEQIPTTRPFASMGFSYERGIAEMLHNLGHRTEATMNRIYDGWDLANPVSNWDRFSANFAQSNGVAGVGTTHYPANAEGDYDTFNQRTVQSWADDYLNYPNLTFQTQPVSRDSWGKGPNPDYERTYQNWYFSRLPRAAGMNLDGKLNNWWKYLYAFEHYTSDGKPEPVEVAAKTTDVFMNGTPYHYFSVQYSSPFGIRVESISDRDVMVIGPNNFQQVAELVSGGNATGTGRSAETDPFVVATYRVAAPGGTWDTVDAGNYSIRLQENEVFDGGGNAISARTIGGFLARQFGPGELLNDSSTSLLLRLDGSLAGVSGESPSNSTQPNYVQGKISQGAMFSDGHRAEFPNLNNISTEAGTIEFWIKPDWNADGTTRTFVEMGNRFNNGMLIAIDGANNLRFIQWGDNPQSAQVESSFERGVAIGAGNWVRNQWRHLAVTWDQLNQSLSYYLDGQLRSTDSGVLISDFANSNFVIGASYDGSQPSNAVIDEFRISTRARTTSEIAASYFSAFGLSEIVIDTATSGIQGRKGLAKAVASFGPDTDLDVTRQVSWTSSNSNIVAISANGEIEFRSPGTAMITATLGGFSDSSQIVVSDLNGPRIESIVFEPSNLRFGQSLQSFVTRFSTTNPPTSSRLGRGDFVIRDSLGFAQFPEWVETSIDSATGQILAKYQFVPPGGYWDSTDNRDYTLDVIGYQIADVDGEFALAETGLATLQLRIGEGLAPIVAPANVVISERAINQSSVSVMSATDPTTGQPAGVRWSIVGGNDGNLFEVRSDSGQVVVADNSKIDFFRKKSYDLMVRATSLQDATLSGQAILRVRINSRFYNVANPLDVDEDGSISPLDVLSVINYINLGGPSVPPSNISSPPFWDTDNDGFVSPLDALSVINKINGGSGRGEGESVESSGPSGFSDVFAEPTDFWIDWCTDEDLRSISNSRRRRL